MKYHETYESYFNDIMKIYSISCSMHNTGERLTGDFKNIFTELLLEKVKDNWKQYESGMREHYHLSDKEFDDVFKEAEYEMTFKSITKLTNLGFLEASIKSDGEVVYSLTEQGKRFADSVDNYL